MIIYEVTVKVRQDLRESFERFMIDRHIPDLMATGCFVSASFLRDAADRYRARYEAQDREALNRYFGEHASRLRGDVAELFPEGISFEREEWEVLARF
jgi:hypothetical protein